MIRRIDPEHLHGKARRGPPRFETLHAYPSRGGRYSRRVRRRARR